MPSPESSVAKLPCLVAAGFFGGLAGFIARVAIAPLGAADLLGMGACVAAAAILATIPFAIEFARRGETTSRSEIAPEKLAGIVSAAVDARLSAALPAFTESLAAALAAADEKRRDEIQAAIAATTPPRPRPIDADAVSVPAGGKTRLGRGLLGLMHGAGAITPPHAEKTGGDDRAAA